MNNNQLILDADLSYANEILSSIQGLLKGSQGKELSNEISTVFEELKRIEIKLMATFPLVKEKKASVIALDFDGFSEYRIDLGQGKVTYTDNLSLATRYGNGETADLHGSEKLVPVIYHDSRWKVQY